MPLLNLNASSSDNGILSIMSALKFCPGELEVVPIEVSIRASNSSVLGSFITNLTVPPKEPEP